MLRTRSHFADALCLQSAFDWGRDLVGNRGRRELTDDLAAPGTHARLKLRCYTSIMTESLLVHDRLSDEQLIAEVQRLAGCEGRATARLIAALAELDARRLYLGQGCSSMFTYCTQVLHLAEHAAYNRIEAARAARRFPVILTLLADGRVHLSAVRLLAPHLTQENHAGVLRAATHKSKREVEQIVAGLQPRPDIAPSVRKLPPSRNPSPPIRPTSLEPQPIAIATTSAVVSPPPRAKVAPLAPERYKVQFTVGRETHEKLGRVQDLLRHRTPNGDLATIFDRAVTLLLADLEKKKTAATARPRVSVPVREHSRHVPAGVRRTVWARDDGRCRFEGPNGRCAETGRLEFHHLVPYASGGPTTADNLELRCAAHNRYEAEQYFGSMLVREEGNWEFGAAAQSPGALSDRPGALGRARSLGDRRDAERAAAVRSRKARPAIPRGDFLACDPRKSVYHRRICAPGTCRPHASVVAAGAESTSWERFPGAWSGAGRRGASPCGSRASTAI